MPITRAQRKRKHREEELETELLACARGGKQDRVHELVKIQRVSVNCADEQGCTPLILAIDVGRSELVRFLLENDANVNASTKNDGVTALEIAIILNDVELTEILLEYGADIEALFRHPDGDDGGLYSPLAWAILHENFEMVSLLLRFGAETQATVFHDKSYCALYFACSACNAEIVQLLLNHDGGAHVNSIIPRSDGRPAMSPLCKACEGNQLEIAQLLVLWGARVIYDDDGAYPDCPSPLMHAICFGSLELVRFLLRASPFSRLVQVHEATLPQMDDRSMQHQQHPLSQPLYCALEMNHLGAAQLLVEHGANVNDLPFLLECAKCQWSAESARLLLRAGADLNMVDAITGATPLWIAARNGQYRLVHEFLLAGADVNIRGGRNNETPLGVAHRQGHRDVVYCLLRTSPHVWSKLGDEVWS